MSDDKDALPADAEKGSLAPRDRKAAPSKDKPSGGDQLRREDQEAEEGPSEQPS